MFSISSSNWCCVLFEVPYSASQNHRLGAQKICSELQQATAKLVRTLKARCSRKWAVPLVSAVSAREPASIHTPTVEVWA